MMMLRWCGCLVLVGLLGMSGCKKLPKNIYFRAKRYVFHSTRSRGDAKMYMYLPEGQDMKTATNLVQITLFKGNYNKAQKRMIDGMTARLKKMLRAVDAKDFPGAFCGRRKLVGRLFTYFMMTKWEGKKFTQTAFLRYADGKGEVEDIADVCEQSSEIFTSLKGILGRNL